jgi:ribosome modulation factor
MASEQREYNRGYEAGVHGKPYDDGFNAVAALTTLGLAGAPRENSASYAEGYRDGREDRDR